MLKYCFCLIVVISLILMKSGVSMRLELFTQSDLMKLKTFVGKGLLPQIKQTLLTNTPQSLERHINHFISPMINKEVVNDTITKHNTTIKHKEKEKSNKAFINEIRNHTTNTIIILNNNSTPKLICKKIPVFNIKAVK